ncbi:MAG: hemolysin family protein [candidate division WOR-3 bacterium]|nr:hemolysin family protein [candidate division WOR-3 bacterium]
MLCLLLLFLAFSFIYSCSETGLFALPSYRRKVNPLIDLLMKNPKMVIVTVVIANVGANVAISSFSEGFLSQYTDLFISSLIVTVFILIFGEYIPKRVAMAKPKRVAILFSPFVLLAEYILYPILLLFKPLSKLAIHKKKFTHGDLREVINRGKREGMLTDQEFKIMHRLSLLNEVPVKEIMRPRTEVFFIEENDSIKGALKKMAKRYKRIPVYAETRDEIVGILELKKLYKKKGRVKDFMSPPVFVSENLSVIQLIRIFKNSSHKMIVVINEYGGTSGVVDIDDVKRELIGKRQNRSIQMEDNNKWIVPGSTDIDEIQNLISIPESNDYRTVSGFIYTLLERIPKEGEVFSYKDYEFTVLDIKDNHIRKVRIKKKE